MGTRGYAFILVLSLSACSDAEPSTNDDFVDSFGVLQDSFGGDGKADLFGLNVDPCTVLRPLAEFGDDAIHSGFMIGVQGAGQAGFGVAIGGADMNWDFYHAQLNVSHYLGGGLGTPAAGASITPYVAAAFGFDDGALDWMGFAAMADINISLPFLKSFLSLNPSVFVSAEDRNNDDVIGPDEIVAPPNELYGFALGVTLGFDLLGLENPLPVGGTLTIGKWEPWKGAIVSVYNRLRQTSIPGIGSLKVRLVDGETGAPCPAGWPTNAPYDQYCVMEFGDPHSSWLERSMYTAWSVCTIAGNCVVPLAWPMAGTAMAIGALRDSNVSLGAMCPAHR